MSGGGLARRYVKPLFEVALTKGAMAQVGDDLAQLDRALQQFPELRAFFNNPSADRRAKRQAAEEIFRGASPWTLNFIRVVLDKNRPGILSEAHRLFQQLRDEQQGITPGSVTTAIPLDEAAKQRLTARLEGQFGKLRLEFAVDPGIIAGVLVRVGNQVIDGTVRGRLARLRAALAGE